MKKQKKKLGLDQILGLIKKGHNPARISFDLEVPKQTLEYYVTKLKKLGCIEKKGYGVWIYKKEVPKKGKGSAKLNSDFKEIRGHAFIWRIEFYKEYPWAKIVRAYKKKKLTFNKICNGRILRTMMNNRKIWLTKKGLTIYEPLSFTGRSSFEVKGQAVFEMDNLVKNLLKELGLKLRTYRFTTSREHYAMVRNELARQYNDKKEKMIIRDESGTSWLWIDHSHGENELETNEPVVSRQVQGYWNSHRRQNFKVDADFVVKNFNEASKQIKKNAEDLGYYAENMVTHVSLMKSIDKNLSKQTDLFEKISKSLESKNV